LIHHGIDVTPNLEMRPGYVLKVMVTQDLVFAGPCDGASMRLERVLTYPATLLEGRVLGELHVTLGLWSLAIQILDQFLDVDRDSRAWRRRTRRGPPADPRKASGET